MKVKIITNSGYRYSGELIEEGENFVELDDKIEGKIKIPLVNISLMQELKEDKHGSD